MSSEPPSANRPSGPPSGPLSGRGSQPPDRPAGEPEPTRPDWSAPRPEAPGGPAGPGGPGGPPAPPAGGRGTPGEGPGEGPGGGARWWRSKKALVSLAAVVVAAALAVFFLRQNSGGSAEVYLQAATANGRDPFTQSTAKDYGASASSHPVVPVGTGGDGGTRSVKGDTRGLYGGSRHNASCDVERQIGYLTQDQARGRAFAGAAGIEQNGLAAYLRGLTPLQLRADTRVTNHGYQDGSVTSYQSVLQAGTAVLVDDRGMPRVRCACGNPLGPPVAAKGTPTAKGDSWPLYKASDVVAVTPADSVLEYFVVWDPDTGEWFERPVGTDGEDDRSTSAPKGGVTMSPKPNPSQGGGQQSPPAPPPPPKSPPRTTPPPAPTTPYGTTPPTQPPAPPAYGPPPVRPR
ncbi:DUF6777 domain-containing protein [Streptomyces sp. NPDC001678]|uniref:DUF6777 domain-containing protein n=1 Tax=Streptomyces sp. NPDC001678 TaxID=3364599 RepID=UPI0036ADC66D